MARTGLGRGLDVLLGQPSGSAAGTMTAPVGAATEMVAMMKALEGLKGLEPYWIKIHTYENEGDQVFRDAVGDLFANVSDPIEIIKWKDIHSLIEVAIDRCEDVANIVEMIVIKHS